MITSVWDIPCTRKFVVGEGQDSTKVKNKVWLKKIDFQILCKGNEMMDSTSKTLKKKKEKIFEQMPVDN